MWLLCGTKSAPLAQDGGRGESSEKKGRRKQNNVTTELSTEMLEEYLYNIVDFFLSSVLLPDQLDFHSEPLSFVLFIKHLPFSSTCSFLVH